MVNKTLLELAQVYASHTHGETIELLNELVSLRDELIDMNKLNSYNFQFKKVDQYIYSNFFFFNDTATTEIYTLSLHDALPI